jgi:hypothetical protein
MEADLAGYNVYRAITSGGPYEPINASLIPASNFVDATVSTDEMYYYVVTALDINDNESDASGEASATPQGSAYLHIESIVLSVDDQGGGNKYGVAAVTILDNLGAPVEGADVTGTFAGDFTGTLTETTDASGLATLIVGPKGGRTQFSFCVDEVIHATLTHDPDADVVTCADY